MTQAPLQTSTNSSQLELEPFTSPSTADHSGAIAQLSSSYAGLTGRARINSENVETGRRAVRELDLDNRTGMKSRRDVVSLLEELAVERGFSWSEIARLCGVTVSAVRKWRAGVPASPENRRLLSRLAAFVDMLEVTGPVNDPASWLVMRLRENYTVTADDLYIAGRVGDLLEFAEGHLDVDVMLDHWKPDWRATNRAEWIVETDADGERLLTRKR